MASFEVRCFQWKLIKRKKSQDELVVSSEPNSITWMIEMDIRKKLGDSTGASIRTDDKGRQ